MGTRTGIFLLLSLVLISIPISAQNDNFVIETSEVSIEIKQDQTYTYSATLSILITSSSSINTIEFTIAEQISNVQTKINGTISPNVIQQENSQTLIRITSEQQLNSNDVIEVTILAELNIEINTLSETQYQLFFNWAITPAADDNNVSITLPRGAIISSSQGDLDIFPSTSEIDSDGEKITISWINLPGTNQNTELFIQYISQNNQFITSSVTERITISEQNSNAGITSILIIIITILIAVSGYLYYQLDTQQKTQTDKQDDQANNNVKIVKVVKPVVLKPKEKEILQLIAEAGGSINQSELVELLDVSKARVSQYLGDFENRNLIKKERMGRENLIQLNIDEQDLL